MSEPGENRFKVSITELEDDAHVPQDELVTELGDDPNEGPITEERRRIEELLKWGTSRGA